jgi:hypothetical protein
MIFSKLSFPAKVRVASSADFPVVQQKRDLLFLLFIAPLFDHQFEYLVNFGGRQLSPGTIKLR